MIRMNTLAPTLTGSVSKELEKEIAAQVNSGTLSPFACREEAIVRRDMSCDKDSALRPAFVRDTEKILHTPAYNRLNGKTQVFSFRSHDDITRRGLHEQLVGRIARDIGRALGLNLDLIEAIALGHDVGHTPFGHAGEYFLNDVYQKHTGRWFFHNVQSVRVLDGLYKRNLSLQTLDGVICHNGEFEQQILEMSNLGSFEEFDRIVEDCWVRGAQAIGHLRPMTLEGCVVRISDIIAYVGKDRQDAIRAGAATEKSFDDGLGGAYNTWALSAFTADIIEHSFGKNRISMSEAAFQEMKRAKRENYQKIYGSAEANGDFSEDIKDLFARLYDYELSVLASGNTSHALFKHHIEPLQRHLSYYGNTYDWERDPHRVVVDFISAMTDDYFVATCETLFPEARKLFPQRSYFGDGVYV